METRLFDTHAHLDMNHYRKDRNEVIKRARDNRVSVLNVGIDASSSRNSLELAQEFDHVFAGVGFHPHEADRFSSSSSSTLRELAKSEKVKCIGEIGLDYYRDNSPRDDQREAFLAQLELAGELGLPVAIHNRSSTEDLLNVLQKIEDLPAGVIHSFFGDLELGEKFLGLGFYLGLSGPLTFGGQQELESVVKELPLDRILLETDSPYLTPQPHRGKRNEPSYVKFIGKRVAKIKGLDFDEVAAATTESAKTLFGL